MYSTYEIRTQIRLQNIFYPIVKYDDERIHCCYLRASVGIAMAILPLEGIYPQIKRAKVLFKTKTNSSPLIFNSIFQTGRQCL